MAISNDEVRLMIEASLPGATVEVVDETGTQDHLRATVAAPQFEGLSRIDQHQLVKNAVRTASMTARCTRSPSRPRCPSSACV